MGNINYPLVYATLDPYKPVYNQNDGILLLKITIHNTSNNVITLDCIDNVTIQGTLLYSSIEGNAYFSDPKVLFAQKKMNPQNLIIISLRLKPVRQFNIKSLTPVLYFKVNNTPLSIPINIFDPSIVMPSASLKTIEDNDLDFMLREQKIDPDLNNIIITSTINSLLDNIKDKNIFLYGVPGSGKSIALDCH